MIKIKINFNLFYIYEKRIQSEWARLWFICDCGLIFTYLTYLLNKISSDEQISVSHRIIYMKLFTSYSYAYRPYNMMS